MEHIDHVLVDDDRGIREMVSGYLRTTGLRVGVAADGRQMRSFLDADRVDLVALDIMMPGDAGLVPCREPRVGRHKATPVLMPTARSDETDRIVGLETGADRMGREEDPHPLGIGLAVRRVGLGGEDLLRDGLARAHRVDRE